MFGVHGTFWKLLKGENNLSHLNIYIYKLSFSSGLQICQPSDNIETCMPMTLFLSLATYLYNYVCKPMYG